MDYKQRDEYEKAQCAKLAAMMPGLLDLLPGWVLKPSDDGERWRQYVIECDGMGIYISLDRAGKWDRVNIGSWHWPKYVPYTDRRHTSEVSITPRELAGSQSLASISVALDRGAAALADGIRKRFLPEYTRLYAECVRVAAERQVYQNACRDVWAEICGVIGKKPDHGYQYGPHGMTLNQRGDKTARLEMDVTPAQLRVIIAALKA